MSYWNKSLHRGTLATRTTNLLADLSSEKEKLLAANTAFGNLACQVKSNSPSVSVIRSVAFKYTNVIDGFIAATEYDISDCFKLLGYITLETEDLIFGELHGNWEVAKERRDKKQTELDTYKRNSTYTTTYTTYIMGEEVVITENHYPDPFTVWLYQQAIDSYQKEMDKYQKKLDRLGEFEDKSGALFANSVDYRTYAVKALSDLKDCVSSDGTFKDINYSYALNQLDKLHEQKQNEYLQKWLDKNGNPDWDAIDKFLYKDPSTLTMDEKLAFCKLMDQMSDEQMTELMNHASRVNYDPETMTYSIEVSATMEEVADLNAALWCAKYRLAGYHRTGFDEEAMNRAIAIKYGVKKLIEMAPEETNHIDPNVGTYKHLAVYVDGSNVYIIPRITYDDCYVYSNDLKDGATKIFEHIIAGDIKFWNNYLADYTLIKVNNETNSIEQLCDSVKTILGELGGDYNPWDNVAKEGFFYALGKFLDVVDMGFVSDIIDFAYFCKDIKDEYDNAIAGQQGIKQLEWISICNGFCITYFTGVTANDQLMGAENIQFNTNELWIRIAAYNEATGGNIDIDWVLNYGSCTPEQKKALALYLDWYNNRQSGNDDQPGSLEYYRDQIEATYIKMLPEIKNPANFNDLTPAQLEEVKKRMEDPNAKIDTSLWN